MKVEAMRKIIKHNYNVDTFNQFYKIGVENFISWAQRVTISQNIWAVKELIEQCTIGRGVNVITRLYMKNCERWTSLTKGGTDTARCIDTFGITPVFRTSFVSIMMQHG
jgi:hypothetical protein